MSPVSFFQPAYAWGLLALAVPIIIHLLRRRRSRKLDFPTLRFFKATALRAHRTRRLKRLLLLCCRLLMVATIVLIFLQPFDTKDPFAALVNPNAALYCWVDPTKSMDYVEGGRPVWRRAMDLVDSLDKKAPYSAGRNWYDQAQDKFVAKTALHDDHHFFTRHGRSFCGNMMTAFHEEAIHSPRPATLVIFSDFQENITSALDTVRLSGVVHARVICVRCGPERPVNAGFRNVVTSRERSSSVSGDIIARGMERRHAGVSAYIGDMRVGHEAIDLQSGHPTTFRMDVAEGNCPGGHVRLEADDPFPIDNIQYFVLGASGRRSVLVVGDSAQSFPLAAAFRSMGESHWSPVIQRTPRDLSINDIDSASLIICNELPFIPRPIHLLRTTRLFGPKAIIVAPAIDSQLITTTASLLGGEAPGTGPRIVRVEKPCGLVLYDTISMLGKGFRRLQDKDAAVFGYAEPLPGTVLCALDNRKPFATHRIDSLGNSWAFFAAPLGRASSNNLCETGLYVPLLDRIARLSLESIPRQSDEWIAGRTRRNPFLGARRPASVYTVLNERLAQWGSQGQVKFDEPGIYRIQPCEGASYWVAVNADTGETALTYRSPKKAVRPDHPFTVIGAEEFLAGLAAGKGGLFSYGPWIALAVLLLAEMLLWEREGGRTAGPLQRKV